MKKGTYDDDNDVKMLNAAMAAAEAASGVTVVCHDCGRSVPLDGCTVGGVLGKSYKVYTCPSCEARRVTERRERLTAMEAREATLSEQALQPSPVPGPASEAQVRTAIAHEEARVRAKYALLQGKRERSFEGELEEDEGGMEGDYATFEYEGDLEYLLERVIDDLTRLRRLSEPLYEPDTDVHTQLDALTRLANKLDQQVQKQELADWRRQQE